MGLAYNNDVAGKCFTHYSAIKSATKSYQFFKKTCSFLMDEEDEFYIAKRMNSQSKCNLVQGIWHLQNLTKLMLMASYNALGKCEKTRNLQIQNICDYSDYFGPYWLEEVLISKFGSAYKH